MSALSANQSYCMTRCCEGAKPARIALEMGATPNTVRTHLLRARDKLGAHTLVEAAVRFAQTEAWVSRHTRPDPETWVPEELYA